MLPSEAPDELKMGGQEPLFTPEQLALVRTVGIIGGVLLVLLLVALSLRRLRARNGRAADQERESVWEGRSFRRDLGDLLQRGRCRLSRAAEAVGRSRLGRRFARLTIRRIYAHLGALAAERGYERASHETPYDYLPALVQAFPESHQDVVRITESYVAVHYAELPELPEELRMVRAAWERIQETAAARVPRGQRRPGYPDGGG